MKTPITKERLKQHLTYSGWKYVAVVIAAIFCWNLIYTMTAYRPPDEKKVEMYINAVPMGVADNRNIDGQSILNNYMEQIRTDKMSDMELMDSVFLTTDSTYSAVQLSTYMAAGEGDLYVLDNESFTTYAKSGGFIPLENDPELMALIDKYQLNVEKGWRTDNESGEYHLFAIPCKNLPQLKAFFYNPEKLYISINVNSGNDDNSLKFLRILLEDALEGRLPDMNEVQ